MRTCQTMFQSVSPTPLSTWMPGRWSRRASGTRHHDGPAGPIMAPASTAPTSTTAATAYHRPAPPRRAGRCRGAATAAVATSTVSAGSAGGDGCGLFDSIVDLLGVLDDTRPPARGDVVVHREDVS